MRFFLVLFALPFAIFNVNTTSLNTTTSAIPSTTPTSHPTTTEPTNQPSLSPSTSRPSNNPTISPSTSNPSRRPSISPSTTKPTNRPSVSPTTKPTHHPSVSPTSSKPTVCPSVRPTLTPSSMPTPGGNPFTKAASCTEKEFFHPIKTSHECDEAGKVMGIDVQFSDLLNQPNCIDENDTTEVICWRDRCEDRSCKNGEVKSVDGTDQYDCRCHCSSHYYGGSCKWSLIEVTTFGIVIMIVLICCCWMICCTGQEKKPRKSTSRYLPMASDGEPSTTVGFRVNVTSGPHSLHESLDIYGSASIGDRKSVNRTETMDYDLVPWNTKSQASTSGMLSDMPEVESSLL